MHENRELTGNLEAVSSFRSRVSKSGLLNSKTSLCLCVSVVEIGSASGKDLQALTRSLSPACLSDDGSARAWLHICARDQCLSGIAVWLEPLLRHLQDQL